MGGRGSSGGSVGSWKNFPQVQKPIDLDNLPELAGTPKQVNWAKSIREQLIEQLANQMYTTAEGNRTDAVNYVTSKKDMQEWVKKTRDAFDDGITSKAIVNEKIKARIESLHTAANQIANLRRLIDTETSAKFWIDHRNTHPADPTWKKLRKSILGY